MIDLIKTVYHSLTDVQGLIQWGGTLLVCAILFTETGLFVGFFLPGDSLLVTAGIFAAAGHLNLTTLLALGSICAVAGDQLGYLIGRTTGQALYRREDSLLFKKRHLERAHDFYERYGGKTIILARYIPIVRTFVPAVAGAASMRYRRFFSYDVFGGILWVCSMVLLGYTLGSAVPDINRHIHYVILVVVFISILPPIIQALRRWRRGTDPEVPRSKNPVPPK
jgi:membrane-associated protein